MAEELQFDLTDGDDGRDELLYVLLGAALSPQPVEQVPQRSVALHTGAHLRSHALLVLGVDTGPRQAEAPSNLRVAVLGRQVQGLHALPVGQVHVAPKRAESLREAKHAFPGTDVDGRLPLAVRQIEVSPTVQQEQGHVAVVPPEGQVETRGAPVVLGVQGHGAPGDRGAVEQAPDALDVAPASSHVQGSLVILSKVTRPGMAAHLIPHVHVCSGLAEDLHYARETVPRRQVEARLRVLRQGGSNMKSLIHFKQYIFLMKIKIKTYGI